MAVDEQRLRALMEKVRHLPDDRLAEVEDFVDFVGLRDRERRLVNDASQVAEPSFGAVWDNPDDAAYDEL